ncbi:TetR/AcrR family transcriptional regulator [Streptomyces acidiscabies]|uniref:TetR/AcrR family transcriptional regulator n=1 Tax=Streptomyces acidiscabies TaxID=42234 RepID=A0AAP6BDQ2_9ACTN|nr:TetR/AcrR family transcriptional regulator [Streptomyces acidiscabies]MBP5941750.1 TetR/AcrR family transcriptional regulator [Streptomyces sp. LBUM 1476]MBZ3913168.1 TetR/AcrR family transcriptional regulator [Streptomyces acidiscabies]MDX2962863.1 TetR/AcrR family transcriptional regulator [Streptomyces acidiscabies]MDX3021374.1 TetR/AcrR family transcriptional regulator [Streptomyces acidiscabies]MDX3790132.1 TetR/AcrR family transcriptional regulator [Streptomyces acidiscabies]
MTGHPTTAAQRSRRSRISPEREAELYDAVLDLLREVGYEGLTMEAVATRTRCSKATLYRQWAGKPELVAKALRHQKPVSFDRIDTGSLRGDLMTLVDQLDDHRMAEDTALIRGLSCAVHAYPELRVALRRLLVDPEVSGLDTLLGRAVERGEVHPDTPALAYVAHMMVGALITHSLIEGTPADAAFLRRYIDSALFPALGV